jgi:hypothetical protein
VHLRGRRWLVEGEREIAEQLTALRLACIDDDAQSESADVVWRAEIDTAFMEDEGWRAVARMAQMTLSIQKGRSKQAKP